MIVGTEKIKDQGSSIDEVLLARVRDVEVGRSREAREAPEYSFMKNVFLQQWHRSTQDGGSLVA